MRRCLRYDVWLSLAPLVPVLRRVAHNTVPASRSPVLAMILTSDIGYVLCVQALGSGEFALGLLIAPWALGLPALAAHTVERAPELRS